MFFCEACFKILSTSFETKNSEQCYLYAAVWCGPNLWLHPYTSLKNHRGLVGVAREVQEKFPVAWKFSSVIWNVWLLLTLLSYSVGAALCVQSWKDLGFSEWHRELRFVLKIRRQSPSSLSWQLCNYTARALSVPSALRWVGVLPLY